MLTKVYVPFEWETVVRLARHKQPYVVVPLKYFDFMDFKQFKEKNFGPMKTDVSGEKVNWLKIKWIQIRKDCPDSIFVCHDFDQSRLREIKITSKTSRRKQKVSLRHPPQAYKEKVPIYTAKKTDLLSLIASGTIPKEYEEYYKALPCSKLLNIRFPFHRLVKVMTVITDEF
jgi:hypothetical protein